MTDFVNLQTRIEADLGRLVKRAVDQDDEIRAVIACLSVALRSACQNNDSGESLLELAQQMGGHRNPTNLFEKVRMFPSKSQSFQLLVKRSRSCKHFLEGGTYDQRVHNAILYALVGLPRGSLPTFYEKWLFGGIYNELATYRVMINHIGPCLGRVLTKVQETFTWGKGYSRLAHGLRQFVDHQNTAWIELVKEIFVPVSPTREATILATVTPRGRVPRQATMVVPGAQQTQLFVGEGEVRTVIGPPGAPVLITPVGSHNRVELDLIVRERSGAKFYFASPAAVLPVTELYNYTTPEPGHSSATTVSGGSAEEQGQVAILLGDGAERPEGRPEHLHPEPETNRALMSVQVDEAYRQLARGEADIWRAAHARVKEKRVTTMNEVRRLRGLVAHLDSGDVDPNNPLTHGRYGPSLTYIHPTTFHPPGQSTEGLWQQGRDRSGSAGQAGGPQAEASTGQRLEAVSRELQQRATLAREQRAGTEQRAGQGQIIASSATAATAATTPPAGRISPVLLSAAYEARAQRGERNLFAEMQEVAAMRDRGDLNGSGQLVSKVVPSTASTNAPSATSNEQQGDGTFTPGTLFSFPNTPTVPASPGQGSAFLTNVDVSPEDCSDAGILLPYGIDCVTGPHTKGRGTFSHCVGPWSPFRLQGACADCLGVALTQEEKGPEMFDEGFLTLLNESADAEEQEAKNDRELKLLEAQRAVRAIGDVLCEQGVLAMKLQLLADHKAPPTAYLARALDLQVELIRALATYATDAVQGKSVTKHKEMPNGLNDKEEKFKHRLIQLYENDDKSRYPFYSVAGKRGQLRCDEGSSAACIQYPGTTHEPVVLTYTPPSSPSDSPSDSDEVQEPGQKRRKL